MRATKKPMTATTSDDNNMAPRAAATTLRLGEKAQ